MRRTISRFTRSVLTRLAVPTMQQFLTQRATLVCGSFLAIALVSAFLYWLPIGLTYTPIRFIDAWILAVSAMTATGAATIDIVQVCTPLGLTFLVVLIHVGGVGFMSITLSILQQFGVRVFRTRQVSGWRLFAGALVIEVWVTVLLALSASETITDYGHRWGNAFWRASIAFANVGFPPLSGSATRIDLPSTAVLAITMLIGSLGLPVLVDVVTHKKRMPQTSLNVIITGFLIVGGASAILLNPLWHVVHTGLTGFEKGFLALHEAISWRTSGYLVTSDIMTLSMSTRFMLLLGMFLGCAPGAMGGGITPTTFAVFLSGILRAVRSDQAVTLFGQRIAPVVVRRAAVIVGVGISVVLLSAGCLLVIEGVTLAQAMIMATAAFATSNVVVIPYAQLHPASLTILSIAMLWGRVGVFAIVLSLYGRATPKSIQSQHVWLG